MFLVFKTDAWHSYASRDIIGLCTDRGRVENLCKAQAAKEGETISDEELWNLNNIKQTQGYSGEGEFDTMEIEENTLV